MEVIIGHLMFPSTTQARASAQNIADHNTVRFASYAENLAAQAYKALKHHASQKYPLPMLREFYEAGLEACRDVECEKMAQHAVDMRDGVMKSLPPHLAGFIPKTFRRFYNDDTWPDQAMYGEDIICPALHYIGMRDMALFCDVFLNPRAFKAATRNGDKRDMASIVAWSLDQNNLTGIKRKFDLIFIPPLQAQAHEVPACLEICP